LLKSRNQSWLRLPLRRLEKSDKAVGQPFEDSQVTYDLDTCTHVDTFRVNVATSIEAREKPFLLSTYPILLEAMIVIGDLNCQQKACYEALEQIDAQMVSLNYDGFQVVYPRVLQCVGQLTEFLLNKSPNNIK
jgi:hypothetical protein